jgi:hypothetical protein
MFLSQYFYGSDERTNIYKDIFLDLMTKRRNKFFTVFALLNTYSLSSKKKLDEIMNDKLDILEAVNSLKNNENIITYYYCKNDKLYYVFEYSINPIIKEHHVEIPINENIENNFCLNLDIEIIKNILQEPKKYINFNPQKNTINKENIIKKIIQANEEKTLAEIIDKYDIIILDNDNDICCGIKYNELLESAMVINNAKIVNIINKCYYEKKYEKINLLDKINIENIQQKKYYYYFTLGSSVISLMTIPCIIYMSLYMPHC